jgi:hypothetical protein
MVCLLIGVPKILTSVVGLVVTGVIEVAICIGDVVDVCGFTFIAFDIGILDGLVGHRFPGVHLHSFGGLRPLVDHRQVTPVIRWGCDTAPREMLMIDTEGEICQFAPATCKRLTFRAVGVT